MFKKYRWSLLALCAIFALGSCRDTTSPTAGTPSATIFRDATVITAATDTALVHTDLRVVAGRIETIGQHLDTSNAEVISLSGKTVMPALICAHAHLGMLKSDSANGAFYTRQNVLLQLRRYADYGVLWVQALGTDQASLFAGGLYDSIRSGKTEGARMLSAGWGFGVQNGAPPFPDHPGTDNVFRPQAPEQVAPMIAELKKYPVDLVKIWVDDLGKGKPKMTEAMYTEIIRQAHAANLRVAAHVFYLEDAKKLVQAGVDILAHSVRDQLIDDSLLAQMKRRNVAYIPTLSLDQFSFIYGVEAPAWLTSPFFRNALEPGVFEKLTAPDFPQKFAQQNNLDRNRKSFATALANLKRVYGAGILVGMGTDSGAEPLQVQGFSEHHELELLVQAGLTPMQAIQTATIGSARVLKLDADYGTLEKGKAADFIVLDANPLQAIRNTQSIEAVYKDGVQLKTSNR